MPGMLQPRPLRGILHYVDPLVEMSNHYVNNARQMCDHVNNWILKNLMNSDGFLPLGLVSMNVCAVERSGNQDILIAGQHAVIAIKKCGHTTNHLLKYLRTLTMKLHATGVHVVTTSGNPIELLAMSNAGIADKMYGRTIDRKYYILPLIHIVIHVECCHIMQMEPLGPFKFLSSY